MILESDNFSWDGSIAKLPNSHILQTFEWALVKSHFGWNPIPKLWMQNNQIVAAAMILIREIKIPVIGIPYRILYVPKGPLIKDWSDSNLVQEVLQELIEIGRKQNAILIKIDPDLEIGGGEADDDLNQFGFNKNSNNIEINSLNSEFIKLLLNHNWVYSREQVQFRNTVISDLNLDEAEILSSMKQKTRYNIRLAEKRGIVVREGNDRDFPMLYRLYAETAQRDGFIIREYPYYEMVWKIFLQGPELEKQMGFSNNFPNYWRFDLANHPKAMILIAEYQNEPIAGIVLLTFQEKAWFMYGMSSCQHREKMPNYLLHWRAMQLLKERGIKVYDWWGAPDKFTEVDPMYGVYKFKMGFGGKAIRRIGAWDYPIKRNYYSFYQIMLPKLLSYFRLKERIGTS